MSGVSFVTLMFNTGGGVHIDLNISQSLYKSITVGQIKEELRTAVDNFDSLLICRGKHPSIFFDEKVLLDTDLCANYDFLTRGAKVVFERRDLSHLFFKAGASASAGDSAPAPAR